ncbi:MAG: glutamate ligase domain-containing protein, partial [Candidatus Paceibacterales bacterium]
VVTGAKGKAFKVIEEVASKNGSKLIKVSTQKNSLGNWLLSKAVLNELKIKFNENSSVFEAKFAGRFEQIQPNVVLDGAHNPDKVKAIIQFLISNFQFSNNKKVVLVVAFKKGKRWRKMIDLLVENLSVSQVIATEFNAVTDTGKFAAVGVREIDEYVRFKHHIPVAEFENSQQAVIEAINGAKEGEIVVVTGSLYLIGEVRIMWKLPEF